MMIFGIGTDLCDVRRIRAVLARRGDRFAERVLAPNELAVFHARRAQFEERGVRYLATRFSAKEAFSKAIGLGMRTPMTWRGCEVTKLPSGKPEIRLHGALAEHALGEALAAPRQHRLDPADVAEVGANAVDHRRRARPASIAAR